MAEEIAFKFKALDDNGSETGFLSKKGRFKGATLLLGEDEVPTVVILRAIRRHNRVVLLLLQDDGSSAPFAFAVTGGDISKLVTAINITTSVKWAEMRREALEKEGRGGTFRLVKCPTCKVAIDLTDRADSAQVFCPYCESIATVKGTPPADESKFRSCDTCGYFAQPKGFTIFYFYFLLVLWGISSRKTTMCNSCMRGEAWKMFFANLLFIVGVPVAITQLCRAYFGGSQLSLAFSGLDKANAFAKAGKLERADELYKEIEDRLEHCAGVRFNHGLVCTAVGQTEEGANHFRKALQSCSNYTPAYEGLAKCLAALGRNDELKLLKKGWEGEGEEETSPKPPQAG